MCEEPERKQNAHYETLDITVKGDHIYGEIYLPDSGEKEIHPCVCLFHGFPGITSNDDIAQALMRRGFVVLRPYYRGAWGSEGIYSFTNAIEDAIAVAEYAYGTEGECLGIDREHIYLAGHSMGGQTVLNAARKLPFIKGIVAMASFNMAYLFRAKEEEFFKNSILPMGYMLHTGSPEELFLNAREHYRETDLNTAFEDLKDRNLLFIEGEFDDVAPVKECVYPLWNQLKAYHSDTIKQLITLQASHDFAECRIELGQIIGDWLQKEELQ